VETRRRERQNPVNTANNHDRYCQVFLDPETVYSFAYFLRLGQRFAAHRDKLDMICARTPGRSASSISAAAVTALGFHAARCA
jgi:cyclopropane fatty-acyl-phospholipid synthase-like methyltransferase